jgi:catechol 2,3-dioxygenase-like lactoylglutathione lyase family enzyme
VGYETVTFLRWNAVCIDCTPEHFERTVAFYAGLLRLEVIDKEPRWAALRDPTGGMGINVQADDDYAPPAWPAAPPAQTMMMHFEIETADVPAAAAHATLLGATQAPWQPPDRDPTLLRVMLDPTGHPFCLWS